MADYPLSGGVFEIRFNEAKGLGLLLPFTARADLKKKKQQQKKNKIKYSCPSCEANIWGKGGLRVICQDCEMEFIEQ